MNTILRQTWAIAATTFLDIIRQPVILLLTVTFVVLTGLLPSTAVFAFGEEARLVRDGALALHLVFGLLLAGMAAASTIYAEIKRGTAATILCKPVSRSLYFAAAYLGVLTVILLFCAEALLVEMLSARMILPGIQTDGRIEALLLAALLAAFIYATLSNFLFRRSFISRAWAALLPCLAVAFVAAAWLDNPYGHKTGFGSLMAWEIIPAGLLVSLALVILTALAVSLSTRLPPVLSTSACAGVFFLGLISDYLFHSTAQTAWWAGLCYQLLPNWQDFWIVDALAGGTIPWSYVGGAALYALLYSAGVLALGLLSFHRQDIV